MKYLVEENGELTVIGAIGFVPRSVVARIPDDIRPEDFEFVEAKTLPADEELGLEERVVAVVNREKKESVLAQREAERAEREAQEKAKRDERQDLLTKLARSNAQGPLADLIRLVLLNEGVELTTKTQGRD